MASSAESKSDRHIVHCLLCEKPQKTLSVHLTRVCMKNNTPEERKTELQRAKDSMWKWTFQARNWDYTDMCRRYPHEPTRLALLQDLQRRNFFIANAPNEENDDQPSTSEASLSPVSGSQSIPECKRVLDEGLEEMLAICENLKKKCHVTTEEKNIFRYYCEAILILKHFQKPAVVKAMTVSNWLNKSYVRSRVCVHVKTSDTHSATFALNKEDEVLLDAYYCYIRSTLLEHGDDDGRFFISSTGGPIQNTSHDLRRLHAHYKLPSVTNHNVRTMVEIAMRSTDMAAEVLTYISQPTEHRYSLEDVVTAANMIDISKREEVMDEEKARKGFSEFLEQFPVTATGVPPSKRLRTEAGFSPDRLYYDRWRTLQYAKREEYLLSRSVRNPPTLQKVTKFIYDEGWTTNCPRPEDILEKWPAQTMSVEDDPDIFRRVTEQKWSGLALKDFGGNKGLGVVATKPFPKGSILCDYHGRVITAAEGKAMMASLQNQMGYLFFFKSGVQDLCVDAQTFPCKCHPSQDTIGRRVNHSKKMFNVKPQHFKLKFPEGEKDAILFKSIKDIKVNEEILYDYGVNRRSFQGEGSQLEWLDE